MIEAYKFESVTAFVGKELGISDWLQVDQATIQAFADCTGDQQWIHTDVNRCKKESPFGGTIAHGFLTLSLLARMLMDVGVVPADASRAINSGVNNVRFKAPVQAGSRVRARVHLTDAQPKGTDRLLIVVSAVLEVENEKDLALTAEMIIMLVR